MGRKMEEAKVVIHMPETEEALGELSRRAAAVHAGMVIGCIRNLNCPDAQKAGLLDALIKSARSD